MQYNWTPVTKQLPTQLGWYLITRWDGFVEQVIYMPETQSFMRELARKGGKDYEKVIANAWMEQPAPYLEVK